MGQASLSRPRAVFAQVLRCPAASSGPVAVASRDLIGHAVRLSKKALVAAVRLPALRAFAKACTERRPEVVEEPSVVRRV